MNILVVGSEIPATMNMAGSPRLFSFCRALAATHRLTLVTLNRDAQRHQDFLADPASAGVFERIVLLPDPPEPTWLGQQAHRLRLAASLDTRVRTPKFYEAQCARIRDVLRSEVFDVVFVDGLTVSQYIRKADLSGIPAIVDVHDSVTMLLTRARASERTWRRRLAVTLETYGVSRIERSLSRVFSTIITNSDVDEGFFKRLDPSANTLTIPNGVDGDFFGSDDVSGDMSRLVFTGVMSYPPNEDAAVHFAEDVLPLVQRTHPHAEFWVVGKSPPDRVRALARRPGVHVTGGVPDVRPYVLGAGIFVCPLRYGAGVKNKLLAALSMKRAVVASAMSLEGLQFRHGEELLIADEPAQVAAHITRLMDDPALARRMGEAGHAAVKSRYSWATSAQMLERVLVTAAGASSERRRMTAGA